MTQRSFDRFKKKSKIFKDINYLLKGYIPTTFENIIHRDNEIEKYMTHLSRAVNNITPDNIFVYGQTGTGKSMVTNFVTSQLEKDTQRDSINVKTVYINCETFHTDISVLKRIITRIQPELALRKVMNSFDAYFNLFTEAMSSFQGIPIIIFDEVDKLANPDVLNILARVKENGFLDRNICIIGVTNDLKFMENLDSRTKSALSKTSIIFPPYDANQLRDILSQRAKEAFHEGVLHEIVIPLCSAYAAKEHGDARRAIDLLRVSGEIAESTDCENVTEEHVMAAKNEIEMDEVKEVIKTLPIHSKLILASCAARQNDRASTSEIYLTYKQFCQVIGMEGLTQRRITDLLSELDMFGIVNTVVISHGRHGRTKESAMNVSKKMVISTLAEDERLRFLSIVA